MEEQSPAAAAPTGSGLELGQHKQGGPPRHGDGAEAVVSSRGVVR